MSRKSKNEIGDEFAVLGAEVHEIREGELLESDSLDTQVVEAILQARLSLRIALNWIRYQKSKNESPE